MKTFEYKIIRGGAGELMVTELNRLGREGWELVSAFKTVDYVHYVLKRSIEAL